MIQRIQSLFLLGVVIISIALFFIPFSQKSAMGTETGNVYKTVLALIPENSAENSGMDVEINYVLLILNLLIMAAAAYVLFLYKNRAAQMRLCGLTGLITGVMLVMVFFYSDNLKGEGNAHYLAGTYLVAAQAFLILAARRFIRKDDMLVRASQRIR